MNKRFGLVGEKLGHTFSPMIHQEIFKRLGINGQYDVLEFDNDRLPYIIKDLKKDGYDGVNITIPYKSSIIKYLDGLSIEAEKIGAINTISLKDDKAIGYNTDYYGFEMLLKHNNIDVKEKSVLVMGTGGVARAVIHCLNNKNAGNIVLASTNIENAKMKYKNYNIVDYDKLEKLEKMDIVINCTPIGMYKYKSGVLISEKSIKNYDIAIDLIYNPLKTSFLKTAEETGLKIVNGLYMLVAQAVKSQEIWNDIVFDDRIIDEINGLLIKELE